MSFFIRFIIVFLLCISTTVASVKTKTLPVIIVYTIAAEAYWESSSVCAKPPCSIDVLLDRALIDLNLSAERSGLSLSFKEVKRKKILNTENSSLDLDAVCQNLKNKNDAYKNLDGLANLGGHLVVLIGQFGPAGGHTCQTASTNHPGLSVLHVHKLAHGFAQGFKYEVESVAFSHEIAHQLGAGHQKTATSNMPATAYVSDINRDGTPDFKTIVTSPASPEIISAAKCFCFSNPDKNFIVDGATYPTGSNDSDNVSVMMSNAQSLPDVAEIVPVLPPGFRIK